MFENGAFVSIIIPTFNRAALLEIALESFINQDYSSDRFEIIVADNNSTDRTKEVVSDWQKRAPGRVKYLFEARQGVHYARNAAAKCAQGEILYFTDDDMIADRSLITEIVKVFDLDPAIGTATGLVLGKFEIEPPTWVKKHLINSWLSLTPQNVQEELIVSKEDCGIYSCHQAVKRDVFFQSGGFNPENTAGIWIGDGETGLNIKIKARGYKFAYTARSIIYHMIPPSRTTFKYLFGMAGNHGFCASYRDYREHRSIHRIIPLMLYRNVLEWPRKLAFTFGKMFLGRLSWHFLFADLMYFHKRNVYDWRLYTNAAFREAVEIDDWINNDRPINF